MLCSSCYKEIPERKEVFKFYNYPMRESERGGIFCKKCAIKKERMVRNWWIGVVLLVFFFLLIPIAVLLISRVLIR